MIYSGIGGWFIGNNPNAKSASKKLSFSEKHSVGNYNINNLKYIYNLDNKEERNKWNRQVDLLNKIHFNGIREFNKVSDVRK